MNVRHVTGYFAMAFSVWVGTGALVRAAPGDLDSSFGDAGFARFHIDGDSSDPSSIFVQTDGKLLVGRINDLATDDFSVLRFNADGTLDPSFNGDGRTSFDIPGGHGWTTAVLQQSDGSIVAAGASDSDFALVRYLADGRPDPSFGADGVVHYALTATAALQQSDAKLVLAGLLDSNPACTGCWDDKSVQSVAATDTTDPAMGLARFDTAGVIDAGFGTDGTIAFDSSVIALNGLVEQPDGKLLVVGSAYGQGFGGIFATVYRLTQEGALDPTFGNAGVVTIGFSDNSDSYGQAIGLENDGRIVVAGTADFPCCGWNDVTGDIALARLNPDGSLDGSFGQGGLVLFDYGASETIDQGGLVIEPSGTIIVAGHWYDVEHDDIGLPTYGLLARFLADGTSDTSFGRGGVSLIDVGYDERLSDAQAHGIVRLPDGTIAAAFTAAASGGLDPAVVIAGVTTADDGPGVIGFTRNPVTAYEGGYATIVVHRTGGAAGAVTVMYATGAGSLSQQDASLASSGADFTPTAGTLSWTDGDTTDRSIAIPIAADTIAETDETFLVMLSNPTGGAGLATSRAQVTIAGQMQSSTPSSGGGGGGASGILETLSLGLLVIGARVRKSRRTRDESFPAPA